jgi:hypothetical protein
VNTEVARLGPSIGQLQPYHDMFFDDVDGVERRVERYGRSAPQARGISVDTKLR